MIFSPDRIHLRTRALVAAIVFASVIPTVQAQPQKQPQKRDLTKGNNLYVVPYAHLDTQWRWTYPQVIREYIPNTMNDNFALIEKYPNYVFNFSGSRRYEMMREYYPASYQKVKEYIKQGRWFPCGSSVDESDANVPSGESLIRQVLYGNRFFKKEFGVTSQEFMLPDCFGFPYALPTILAHCGLDGFSTQKLTWGSAVGIPFKVGQWEGPDGSKIVAALDPGAYVGEVREDLSQNTSWLARIQNTGKQSGAFVDYHYYGTGDRGGAPTEGSVQWVEKSIAGNGPVKVHSKRADEMFVSLTPQQKAKLPQYKGEFLLTEHSAGSVTSQAYMKRWNRKSELLGDAAERASVTAMWLGGYNYPSERLYQAWDLVLGTQMHDMLPGTSHPKAYEYCWNDYVLAMNKFAGVTDAAVTSITSTLNTNVEGTPLVVYNPLSVAREDVVEATVPKGGPVFGPDGRPVPTQILGTDGNAHTRLLFLATVPANGFATFEVRPTITGELEGQVASDLKVGANGLESNRFKVTVNSDGDISSIYDKKIARELLKAPTSLDLQFHNPRSFPAWNMDWDDAKKPPYAKVAGPAKITVVENGPVRVALQVERETGGSKFVQQIRLSAGGADDRVEIANKIDWQTKESALKASFPLTTGNPKATYDLQVGAIERGNNDPKKYEVPQHQWMDLTKPDGSYGAAIINDSKFGSDKPDDDTMRLTLLYTPGVRGGYHDQATQDFGRHDILYAVAPHAGTWQNADIPWIARRVNQPMQVFRAPKRSGKLGKSVSLGGLNTTQVEIMAVKKAEDNDEVIVRLRELEGRPAAGVELKMAGRIVSAREVNGQEYPVGAATVRNGAVVTSVPAFGLKTFALKLAPAAAKAARVESQTVALEFDVDVASTDGALNDGAFDSVGRTYPAEQMPKGLELGGVKFKLGSTAPGAKNAMTARGQNIRVPAGYSKAYILAASSDGDFSAIFINGGEVTRAKVQDWHEYVGQWDNRLWLGVVPEQAFDWHNPLGGLVPGFVEPSEVAWYASHRHHPEKGNEFYEYSYIFKYEVPLLNGDTSIAIPNDPRVKIFAVSVARNVDEGVEPAAPLFDTLADHQWGGQPTVSPANGSFNDVTAVTINPPLYWRAGMMRYTLDGSEPTAASPVYTDQLMLSDASSIKVAMVDEARRVGPVTTANLSIKDTTAPVVARAISPKALGVVTLRFSEKVTKESAERAGNYRFSSGAAVTSAVLQPNGQSLDLVLDKPLPAGAKEVLSVSGVADLSQSGNKASTQIEVAEGGAVFTSPALEPSKAQTFRPESLPMAATAAWTINLFLKVDQQPEDRTIIAGFGRASDGPNGSGRYLTKFPRGIHFWSANQDVPTNVALDLGKWQMLTATYDGAILRVYKNGEKIGERAILLVNDEPRVRVFPLDAWERQRSLKGDIKDFTIWNMALPESALKRLWETGQR